MKEERKEGSIDFIFKILMSVVITQTIATWRLIALTHKEAFIASAMLVLLEMAPCVKILMTVHRENNCVIRMLTVLIHLVLFIAHVRAVMRGMDLLAKVSNLIWVSFLLYLYLL